MTINGSKKVDCHKLTKINLGKKNMIKFIDYFCTVNLATILACTTINSGKKGKGHKLIKKNMIKSTDNIFEPQILLEPWHTTINGGKKVVSHKVMMYQL